MLSLLLGALWAYSQEESTQDEAAEITFEVQDVEDDNGEGVLRSIGRFHPIFIHFPIAWLILLILCDATGMLTKRDLFLSVSPYLLVVTLIGFLPAIATGLSYFQANREYMEDVRTPILHRNIMIATFLLLVAAGAVRARRRGKGSPGWFYLILTWMAGLCLTYGADLGGEMVFGEGIIPFRP